LRLHNVQSEFLLQFLVVALDAPAQFGGGTNWRRLMASGRFDSQYFVGSFSVFATRSAAIAEDGAHCASSLDAPRARAAGKNVNAGAACAFAPADSPEIAGAQHKASSFTESG